MDAFSRDRVCGFLHTDGRLFRNEKGEEILLRGYGAGNWTNPEGFYDGRSADFSPGNPIGQEKLYLPERFDRARSLASTVRELAGTAYEKTFWPRWYRNQLGEDDIRTMAEMGFNSIRLPLCGWAFLPEEPEIAFNEDSFAMLDNVLDWCEKYRIYAILDLHAAPGGQSALNCDDGIDNQPHMFTEPESRERTLILWEELARRYRDRWIVAGYEPLNEPISTPNTLYLMDELKTFYDACIERIRKIDRKHVIFLEGATFSTNVEVYDHDYDPEEHNWAMVAHLYGFSPEMKDLYKFLLVSHRWNVPLWIGEGASSDDAMTVFYELAAQHHVSVAVWTWKAAQEKGDPSLVSYPLPQGWERVQAFITKGGPRPSYAESQQLLDAYLENLKFEHCTVRWDRPKYILRQPGIQVPAAGYDDEAFSGGWMLGNFLNFRLEDRTKLVLRPGAKVPAAHPAFGGDPAAQADPLHDLWLELAPGAFASYTLRAHTAPVPVSLRARVLEPAVVQLSCDEQVREISVPAGAGPTEIPGMDLAPAERSQVKVTCLSGTIQLVAVVFGEQKTEP